MTRQRDSSECITHLPAIRWGGELLGRGMDFTWSQKKSSPGSCVLARNILLWAGMLTVAPSDLMWHLSSSLSISWELSCHLYHLCFRLPYESPIWQHKYWLMKSRCLTDWERRDPVSMMGQDSFIWEKKQQLHFYSHSRRNPLSFSLFTLLSSHLWSSFLIFFLCHPLLMEFMQKSAQKWSLPRMLYLGD